MYFNRLENTIGAIATAPGSTIGIVRVSGDRAFNITATITGVENMKPNTFRLVSIHDNSGTVIDKALLLFFQAPASFTGEDVVELHLHGSALHAQDVLSLLVEKGVLPALNGEFSFRAVVNGKMNINQASNLSSMIVANDNITLAFARKEAFENRFFNFLKSLKPEWQRLYALSTAVVDFPEQVDQFLPESEINTVCSKTKTTLNNIVENSKKLDAIKSLSVVIAGKPNVGKSSLFNLLSNKDRAIVSDEAGTTRDYINETIKINNLPIKLFDTAGIRKGKSKVEQAGIQKAMDLLGKNDLALLVLDGSKPLSEEDDLIIESMEGLNYITVINKCDLNIVFNTSSLKNPINISIKTEEGINLLLDKLEERIKKLTPDISEPVLTHSWQKKTCLTLLETITELEEQLEYCDIEIIAILIKECYITILKLLGEEDKVDIYDLIFSSFCLGK